MWRASSLSYPRASAISNELSAEGEQSSAHPPLKESCCELFLFMIKFTRSSAENKTNRKASVGTAHGRPMLLCFLCLVLLAASLSFACGVKNGENQGSSPLPSASPSSGADEELSCTLYIECTTILNNMDKFNTDKLDVLPENGIVLEKCTVSFKQGESVYDMMVRTLKSRKIHMEYSYTPVYDSAYVEGINNLYEFDCGEGSGWTFSVNGAFPNYGCSKYILKDGDAVEWHYTCDFGADVGSYFIAGQTPNP